MTGTGVDEGDNVNEPAGQPWPSVSVVVATRDREELLARTLEAIARQDYAGEIEVVLVYDQAEPRPVHERDDTARRVRVTRNQRTTGLAGARNTGIAAASGELVAFCDDDDTWRPDKLRRQVLRMREADLPSCVTGIAVHYGEEVRVRVPDAQAITPEHLLASRMTGAHPSSYLMTRAALDAVGPVDEELPGGYGEDWDFLLRLARHAPVAVVGEPLVDVLWHRGSFFTSRWESINDSVDYLLVKYPELRGDRAGLARLHGQRAFALAALGRRREALRAMGSALRARPTEPRVPLAALVAARAVTPEWVMHQANSRGRGI